MKRKADRMVYDISYAEAKKRLAAHLDNEFVHGPGSNDKGFCATPVGVVNVHMRRIIEQIESQPSAALSVDRPAPPPRSVVAASQDLFRFIRQQFVFVSSREESDTSD